MARLGLDINLALQRLLGANKERAAANRSELEDRKLRKENAAEKAQLAADAARPGSPTGAEEIRGGTPQLYRAPEPAAQRRKKVVVELGALSFDYATLNTTTEQAESDWTTLLFSDDFFANNPDREYDSCPADEFNGEPYTAYVSRGQVWYGVGSKMNNIFTHARRELFANLYRAAPGSSYTVAQQSLIARDKILTSGFDPGRNLTGGGNTRLTINWVVRQGSYPDDPQEWRRGCGISKVYTPSPKRSNPPAFPLTEFRRGVYTNRRVISSTKQHTYISYLINSNVYYPDEYGGDQYIYTFGDEIPDYLRFVNYTSGGYVWKASTSERRVEWYGVYLRQDNKTKEVEMRVQLLTTREATFNAPWLNESEPVQTEDIAAFVSQMDQADPRRIAYATNQNASAVTTSNWNNLAYDPSTGVSSYTLQASDKVWVYTAGPRGSKLPKGLDYNTAFTQLFVASSLTPLPLPEQHTVDGITYTLTHTYPRQSNFQHTFPVIVG